MSETPPFEVAAAQAMSAAAESIKFLVTVAMAIKDRHDAAAENRDGFRAVQVAQLQQLNGPAEVGTHYASLVAEHVTNPGIRDALLASPQWPQIAADLHQLEQAGVNVRDLLSDASRTADRVAASLMPPQPVTTAERYAAVVREHVPNEQVREALLGSAQWPQIAEHMQQMEAAGINVPEVLAQANQSGAALTTALQTAYAQTAQRAAALSAENSPAPQPQRPGTAPVAAAARAERLADMPAPRGGRRESGGLANRAADLKALGISKVENQRLVRMIRDTVQNEHHAGLIVVSSQWPQIAAQMRDLEQRGIHPGNRLVRLSKEVTRRAVAGGERVNIAAAAVDVLSRPAAGAGVAAANSASPQAVPAAAEEKASTREQDQEKGVREAALASLGKGAPAEAAAASPGQAASAQQTRAAAATSHSTTTSGPPSADADRPAPAAAAAPAPAQTARARHGHSR
ncbi:hypothetical protein [Streptomyces sp. NPDC051162]|uniref:hypothetical protein n=1 Tax=Streptomyces sp. NPDC051162 TaxID=3154747 RepID=UPI00342F401D